MVMWAFLVLLIVISGVFFLRLILVMRNSISGLKTAITIKGLIMINIKVGDKWVITSDSLQFILNKKIVAKSGIKKGEVYLKALGYYPRMSQLVNGLIHFHLHDSDVKSISALADELERISSLCGDAFTAARGLSAG